MELYAQVLNYAIPFFVVLIGIEFWVGRSRGVTTLKAFDTISSLSSGLTNSIKDVLGLTIIIISYSWLYEHIALIKVPKTWWLYVIAFIGLDFAGYWSHRFEHRINILWNRHIIHHSSEEFNLACALRQPVSTIFALFFFLMIPTALLGVPPDIIAIVAPLHLFAQFWYHTRLIDEMGWLETWLVTPSHHSKDYMLLRSVPGIAGLTAGYILSELGDLRRFTSFKRLASYVGFIPSIQQSGEGIYTGGSTPRANRHVRNMIIEASWQAVRKDPVMQNYYRSHQGKNSKAAIFKVGRKLLSKIHGVIRTEIPYSVGVIK